MSYTLQAVIAKVGTLTAPRVDALRTITLSQGIEMLPLSTAARAHFGIPSLPLTDESCPELPSALTSLCSQLSNRGLAIYVEAEFFGGVGTQAHVVFEGTRCIAPPLVSPDAINVALRMLGACPLNAPDEFAAVGLGRFRHTDEWTPSDGVASSSPRGT